MDNFTPLKPAEKKKKKFNKFLIFGNLFLIVLVAVIGIVYYNRTLVTTQRKAEERLNCNADHPKWECIQDGCCWQGADDGCAKPGEPGYDPKCIPQPGAGQCQTCGEERPKCPNGQPPVCDTSKIECVGIAQCQFPRRAARPLTSCGTSEQIKFNCYTDCSCNPEPTATPTPPDVTNTPTPTDVITNTPTPTATPTNTPTATPTSTPTNTPTPTTPPGQPTNTPGPTSTPIPVPCGTKSCDNTTNPCRDNYICVQANDGSNYCTSPDFQTACKANPTYNNCCTAPGAPTATPTEIILAKVSPSPTSVEKLLQTGVMQSFVYLIPAFIMLIGLIL